MVLRLIKMHIHIFVIKINLIVHNGIIENFKSLKNNLIEKGVIFKSEKY